MPRIRPCRFSRKAPTWRSRTAWCWRGASKRIQPQEALQRYQRARIERTNSIVTKSTENARRFHNPALAHAEGADDYVSREWQPERVRERYDWLFEYDALSVAI